MRFPRSLTRYARPSWSGSTAPRSVLPGDLPGRDPHQVRRDHRVENRAAHLAVGVDMEGIKHVFDPNMILNPGKVCYKL